MGVSLVVETGTGTIASANSYTTLASANGYFELKGNSTWLNSDVSTQTYSLIKACFYLELLPWRGYKALSTQPLEWPRSGVTDKNGWYILSNEIPRDIKWAQYELAYRYLSGNDPLPDINAGDESIRREKVDVIEVEYFSGKSTTMTFSYIDELLDPYTKSRVSIELLRA